MKIYTRTGDAGVTGLSGGSRVPKDDPRIAAYGTVDELNAVLGLCRAAAPPSEADEAIELLQHEMFALGAELSHPDPAKVRTRMVDETSIERIEKTIDRFESDLTPLRNFILPSGTQAAASLHLARCVCRRAERETVALARSSGVREEALRYLNRVSDLLFVMARWCNARSEKADVIWKSTE